MREKAKKKTNNDEESLEECIRCGKLFPSDELIDRTCQNCREILEDPFYEEGIAQDEDDWESEDG